MQAEVQLRAGDATVLHSSRILIEVFTLKKVNNFHSDSPTCLLQLMAFSYSSIFFVSSKCGADICDATTF